MEMFNAHPDKLRTAAEVLAAKEPLMVPGPISQIGPYVVDKVLPGKYNRFLLKHVDGVDDGIPRVATEFQGSFFMEPLDHSGTVYFANPGQRLFVTDPDGNNPRIETTSDRTHIWSKVTNSWVVNKPTDTTTVTSELQNVPAVEPALNSVVETCTLQGSYNVLAALEHRDILAKVNGEQKSGRLFEGVFYLNPTPEQVKSVENHAGSPHFKDISAPTFSYHHKGFEGQPHTQLLSLHTPGISWDDIAGTWFYLPFEESKQPEKDIQVNTQSVAPSAKAILAQGRDLVFPTSRLGGKVYKLEDVLPGRYNRFTALPANEVDIKSSNDRVILTEYDHFFFVEPIDANGNEHETPEGDYILVEVTDSREPAIERFVKGNYVWLGDRKLWGRTSASYKATAEKALVSLKERYSSSFYEEAVKKACSVAAARVLFDQNPTLRFPGTGVNDLPYQLEDILPGNHPRFSALPVGIMNGTAEYKKESRVAVSYFEGTFFLEPMKPNGEAIAMESGQPILVSDHKGQNLREAVYKKGVFMWSDDLKTWLDREATFNSPENIEALHGREEKPKGRTAQEILDFYSLTGVNIEVKEQCSEKYYLKEVIPGDRNRFTAVKVGYLPSTVPNFIIAEQDDLFYLEPVQFNGEIVFPEEGSPILAMDLHDKTPKIDRYDPLMHRWVQGLNLWVWVTRGPDTKMDEATGLSIRISGKLVAWAVFNSLPSLSKTICMLKPKIWDDISKAKPSDAPKVFGLKSESDGGYSLNIDFEFAKVFLKFATTLARKCALAVGAFQSIGLLASDDSGFIREFQKEANDIEAKLRKEANKAD